MFLKRNFSLLVWLLFCWQNLSATDTLTVEDCRKLAAENSPLQRKKALAENAALLNLENIHSNSKPRISASAQASWQTDVFGLPFKLPGSEVPTVPRDQYKLAVDVAQRIYDGGSDGVLRQQKELEKSLAVAQVDADVFQLRELTTDLFFKILILQETEVVLLVSKKDLDARLAQAEAMVREGVALRTTADQVRVQILKIEQQIEATRSDKLALQKILGQWIGKDNFELRRPVEQKFDLVADKFSGRPELQVLNLQTQNLQVAKSGLALKSKPKVEAFVQGGVGRPNPLNFFETGFQPFGIVGLRAAWQPIDWGNRRRDLQIIDFQSQTLQVQREAMLQRWQIVDLKEQQDLEKMHAQLVADDKIIALQEDILKRADAQVKNGVMTMTDYLAQQNLLTQARLTRATHEIQAIEAAEKLRARGTVDY